MLRSRRRKLIILVLFCGTVVFLTRQRHRAPEAGPASREDVLSVAKERSVLSAEASLIIEDIFLHAKTTPPTAKTTPPKAYTTPPTAKITPPKAYTMPPRVKSKTEPEIVKTTPPKAYTMPPRVKSKTEPESVKTTPPTMITSKATTPPSAVTKLSLKPLPNNVIQERSAFFIKMQGKLGIRLSECSVYSRYKPLTERHCTQYEDMRFHDDGESDKRVALASYPGSGNTWMRLLLEEVTGILTGSVYDDKTLKCTGFFGESEPTTSKRTLVIKTHEGNGNFDAVVLLFRNPWHAFLSYYRWMATGSHTKGLTRKSVRIPDKLFATYKSRWEWIWEYYVENSTVPVYFLQYEKLKVNLESELRGVLKFLNQTINEEKLKCILNQQNDQYKRSSMESDFPYTDTQKLYIQGWIDSHKRDLAKLNIDWQSWTWN